MSDLVKEKVPSDVKSDEGVGIVPAKGEIACLKTKELLHNLSILGIVLRLYPQVAKWSALTVSITISNIFDLSGLFKGISTKEVSFPQHIVETTPASCYH